MHGEAVHIACFRCRSKGVYQRKGRKSLTSLQILLGFRIPACKIRIAESDTHTGVR
ncbi:unnamed protein product [Periconia digitata]|uniref:Uncharacterized protein n=1 Tax=Periconia digitata TaxID=1303443 RepID=A0A9W4UDI5_9PLEO|nr:unnamed protein product [Periconia digitata]